MDNITLYYNIDNDIPCLYINRLEESLEKDDKFSIYTIEKKLESIIDGEIKDINVISKRLDDNLTLLYNRSCKIKNVFYIAKILARDFEKYGKKLLMYNQINTIKLYGMDEDKILDLQDSIDEHKLKLKKELDKLTIKYRSFLDEANDSYNKLDDSNKQGITNTLLNLLKINNIDINTIDDNIAIQENRLFDIIFGTLGSGLGFLWGIAKKFWVVIIGVLGLNYLTNNFIFRLLNNFLPIISNAITTFLTLTIIFLGCSLAIKLYHLYYDYKYTKENKELSNRLNEINKNAKNPNNKIKSLNTNKEESFRGFNNTASYNPNGANAEDPRYQVF